jgi:hypothetical protein
MSAEMAAGVLCILGVRLHTGSRTGHKERMRQLGPSPEELAAAEENSGSHSRRDMLRNRTEARIAAYKR